VITAIDIENLRGIARGRLEGLAPLTILTGPNGCGKSTVLDALLIGGSSESGSAIGHVVERRPETRDGARWLIGAANNHASITTTDADVARKTLLTLVAADDSYSTHDHNAGFEGPFRAIQAVRTMSTSTTKFNASNTYRVTSSIAARSNVRLIDPGLTTPLVKIFSEATRRGGRADAYAFLADLIPGFQSLDILTEDDGTPALYTTMGRHAIPVGLAGDGIQSFIQLALELSALVNGLALIEEPEVYQHPRAIQRTARVLLVAIRRGIQIVLSTHSLELIDALLDAASDTDLPSMALFNLDLRAGDLRSSRYSGADIAFNRDTIANSSKVERPTRSAACS